MPAAIFSNKLKYAHIYLSTIIIIALTLFLDSPFIAGYFPPIQQFINIFALVYYLWLLRQASGAVRQIIFYGLAVAALGETFFSLVLGMYGYRLSNIPIYVILGHMVLYTSTYYMAREPMVKKHREKIFNLLYPTIFIYSLLWLIFANDILGFLYALGALWILKYRLRHNISYLFTYYMVIYLELVGTMFHCWKWAPAWLWIPSANPPSGIAFFYILGSLGYLFLYKEANPKRWERMKKLRAGKFHNYVKSQNLYKS